MNLTENFTLSELIQSDTAEKYGYSEQFQPPNSVINNLKLLAENILQPLRDNWDKEIGWKNEYGEAIDSNCGYRCVRTNTAVGGQPTSQHLFGMAVDITAGSKEENKILFQAIQDLKLPFDQLIDERNYSWIHVSYCSTKHRRQILHL